MRVKEPGNGQMVTHFFIYRETREKKVDSDGKPKDALWTLKVFRSEVDDVYVVVKVRWLWVLLKMVWRVGSYSFAVHWQSNGLQQVYCSTFVLLSQSPNF
ncbi:MAG: hypothetical protein CVU39_19685 [Chloroflexi bacterium HGW-Chloroflexi-10]|nr:MAG: hypothetical protein CVU39_19685 [Chloroflexi bacterium HGW-Chloroflexi-10]